MNTEKREPQLTAREQSVLVLASQGHQNKGIARELGIQADTVKCALSRVYLKLRVANRTEAVSYAMKSGIL
jgi:LuxR family transcriptional regulator, maltose regulon positive regulatory protein